MTQIKVSKLDAARRQLDGAIQLWFYGGDPVAIHALACAAHQVIQDIAEKKSARQYHLKRLVEQVVEPSHVQEAMDAIRKPMMFFKHADRDPHDVLEFEPRLSEVFIMLAGGCLRDIGESVSDIQRAFLFWHRIHDTGWVKKEALEHLEDRFGADAVNQLRNIDKREFLQQVLLVLAQLRAARGGL
jgi:hypothetical protein